MTEPAGVKTEGLDKTKGKPEEGGLVETIKVVLQALAIALVVRTFLFQPFNIPTGSLIPTLLIGDYLFVSKYSYGYSKNSFPFSPDLFSGRIWAATPKRGDIAVFKLPRDGSTDYIKRVVGLPGDRVQFLGGRLYINGQVVPRERAPDFVTRGPFGRDVATIAWWETLPGANGSPPVRHMIIEREGDRGFFDNTPVYEVPQGNYFMIGDNRDNSTDSRVPAAEGGVGPVPFENFVGRAEIIFFSVQEDEAAWQFWKWPWTVRWNRIFQTVK